MALPQVLIILAFAVLAVIVFRALRLGPVLGYLAAGALIGPHALGLVRDVETIDRLAELGVVFLLFSIGLELSLERLLAMRRQVFGLGLAQVAVTAALVWAALRALGTSGPAAVVLAGGLALSSTAVVLRVLEDAGELGTRTGRLAVAVLLFQDLAVVPLITVVPLLSGDGATLLRSLALAAGTAVAALAGIFVAGRVAVRPLLRLVAGSRTPEVFTGIALLLVLGVGWATHLAGLSMALGAFLAGVLISETEYRHQVEADIEPFRGLLLALFFMSVGMGLDAGELVRGAPLVVGGALALLALKAALLAALALASGSPPGVAVRLGLTLSQGGEFAFVVFALAAASGTLPPDTARTAGLVVALTMALTPLLAAAGRRVERGLAGRAAAAPGDGLDLEDRVLIAGFGRVGQTMARLLEERGVPYVALDADPAVVTAACGRGLPAFFGDSTRAEVLRAVGAGALRAAVVTLDQPGAAERAVAALRRENPGAPVLVRARTPAHSARLLGAGATAVVPELVEGSLQLGEELLLALDVPRAEAVDLLDRYRQDSYALLGDLLGGGVDDGGASGHAAAGRRGSG
jgi:CPA2 family monovalent cation:H+ antiporter-2